jgi:hypothetical protein
MAPVKVISMERTKSPGSVATAVGVPAPSPGQGRSLCPVAQGGDGIRHSPSRFPGKRFLLPFT